MLESVNNFGWKYFKTLDRAENIFYSPYSIAAALSIVANGAIKTTRAEILSALGVDSVGALNGDFKNFRASLEKFYSDENILRAANLMLVNQNFIGNGLNPTFENVITNIYNSEIRAADFDRNLECEKSKITAWIDDKTSHFISDFRAEPSSNTIVALLNVIYFKGNWQFPFDDSLNREKIFTNRDGSKSSVQMMCRTFDSYTGYHSDKNFRGIRLAYKDSNVAMYFILPKDTRSLNVAEEWNAMDFAYKESFIAQLDTLPRVNGQRYTGDFDVEIPRFELDIENKLIENLRAVGISRAFTDKAEFFNIVENEPLKINNATHRAKIKVAERGTESGAFSFLDMICGSDMPLERTFVEFFVDRPFIFLIRDVQSGVELFTGVVNSLK